MNDLQLKTDFEYEIVHPYAKYGSSTIEEMPKNKVTLKLCTLLKGVPYGPAYLEHIDPKDKGLSF